MTRQLTYSVVADGGTDRALIPIINWAIHRLDPGVDVLEPEFRKRTGPLKEYLADYESGSMIVFVHRDAEVAGLGERLAEFDGIARADVVPIVPVRMTEAWLLVEAKAIALAADRPDSKIVVPLPKELESIADPKERLEDLLRSAAGLTGRRAKMFNSSIVDRRVNVANLITDFSPLEAVGAFREFQRRLEKCYPYRLRST